VRSFSGPFIYGARDKADTAFFFSEYAVRIRRPRNLPGGTCFSISRKQQHDAIRYRSAGGDQRSMAALEWLEDYDLLTSPFPGTMNGIHSMAFDALTSPVTAEIPWLASAANTALQTT
jgi:hypothetical protein